MKYLVLCIAAVLMATGWVGAQTVTTVWNPAANGVFPPAGGDWSDGANWTGSINPNTGPDGGNGSFKCVFNVANAADCVLDAERAVNQVVIGDNGPGGRLIVKSGGVLSQNTSQWFGVGFNHTGQMDVETGATVNTGDHLWVGFEPGGTGTVNLNGGTINVQQQFGLGWNGGTGFFNANEGVAHLTEIHPSLSIRGPSVLDVRWATVTIIGNHTGSVHCTAAGNHIRAFGGDGTLNVSFDGGLNRTIITATHSMNPSPGFDETVLTGPVTLSWNNLDPANPGNQVIVNVWFGTEPDKLALNYTQVLSGSNVTGQARSSVIVSAPTNGIYYWQVDTDNGSGAVIEGDVFKFQANEDLPTPVTVPIVPAWHVDTLLTWDPATDPASKYNVGAVPLQSRTSVPANLQANSNARSAQGYIQTLDTHNGSTSGNPAQGSTGSRYTFTYWQYVRETVYWGGSAGEGIIVPPSAEMIDCAHRNGTLILGSVFFPPTVFGGQVSWVRDFVQKSGNTFPVADKLIEAAKTYGFDGWFFNQETRGTTATDAANMRDMIKYIRDNSDLRIAWYDAMTESGPVSWQDRFNGNNDWYMRHNYNNNQQDGNGDLIAHNIFLDFVVNSTTAPSSRNHALGLGLDPYDIVAGFELQANNFKTTLSSRANIETVFPAGQDHILSAGIFIPREHAVQLADQDLFWSGSRVDPRDTATPVGIGRWNGVAHNIAAESPATEVPFMTNFCLGHGSSFFINGSTVSTQDWWNRSLQDVLPTWRWIIDSTGTTLTPELINSDGYYAGGCLQVSGNLDTDNILRLYLADLPVQSDTHLRVTFKRSSAVDSQMQVGISFTTDPTTFVYYHAGTNTSSGWDKVDIPIGTHTGKSIAAIGLKFLASPSIANYSIKIGQLGVVNTGDPVPAAPTHVRVIGGSLGDSQLNVGWVHSTSEVYYYNVYSELSNGTLVYAGSTPHNCYYTPLADPSAVGVAVIAVGPDMAHSNPGRSLLPEDLDGSGLVDLSDFAIFSQYFNQNTPIGNFDGVGLVDITDFKQLVGKFLDQ